MIDGEGGGISSRGCSTFMDSEDDFSMIDSEEKTRANQLMGKPALPLVKHTQS